MAKLEAKHAGCWFDCARGIYIGQAVIEEAQAYGWDWKANDWQETDFHPDSEHYLEAWDAATEYLDGLAPEGFWIGMSEGDDFGMWAIEEEDCG